MFLKSNLKTLLLIFVNKSPHSMLSEVFSLLIYALILRLSRRTDFLFYFNYTKELQFPNLLN